MCVHIYTHIYIYLYLYFFIKIYIWIYIYYNNISVYMHLGVFGGAERARKRVQRVFVYKYIGYDFVTDVSHMT